MTQTLEITRHGTETGHPLVIVPGLFGSARNWGVIAKRLSAIRPVITVDMRNHGSSFHADTHSYIDMAGDLARVIEDNTGQADVLGHSMGGKAAMVLALLRPELVRRLIVADIAPVAYTHEQSDKIEALKSVDLSRVTRRRDAEAQLMDAIPDPQIRAFLLQSLTLGDGAPYWKLNLDVLASEMPKILSFPEISASFPGPALFLSGADSQYILPEYEGDIRRFFPSAKIETIANSGHWLHAEQPRAFELAVNEFLAK